MRIGIDFGGVLSIDDSVTQHKNTEIDMPGAKEAIIELAKTHELFLISFCGKRRAIETRESIIASDLNNYFTDMYFVKHPDYKAQLIQYLKCNVMIDDRKDVLENISHYTTNIHTILFRDWLQTISIIQNLDISYNIDSPIMDISRYYYKI